MKHILKRLFKSKICRVMLILLEHNEKIEKIWEGKINNPKNNGKRKRKIPTSFKMIIGSYQVIFFKTILRMSMVINKNLRRREGHAVVV